MINIAKLALPALTCISLSSFASQPGQDQAYVNSIKESISLHEALLACEEQVFHSGSFNSASRRTIKRLPDHYCEYRTQSHAQDVTCTFSHAQQTRYAREKLAYLHDALSQIYEKGIVQFTPKQMPYASQLMANPTVCKSNR